MASREPGCRIIVSPSFLSREIGLFLTVGSACRRLSQNAVVSSSRCADGEGNAQALTV